MKNSIKRTARMGGLLYLIIIVVGLFSELCVRGHNFVKGDAAATAQNIREAEFLWRMSIAGELFMLSCAIALALIFYVLLKPVSKQLALLAVLFNLVSIALEVSNKMYLLGALFPLGDGAYLDTFQPNQLNSLAYGYLKAHQYGYGVSLIFFGWECILLGYLIFKSGYFPSILGVLMMLAGACYLTNSFGLIIAPEFSNMLFPFIMAPVFIAELSLCVWLLVKGVNVSKWEEMSKASSVVAE